MCHALEIWRRNKQSNQSTPGKWSFHPISSHLVTPHLSEREREIKVRGKGTTFKKCARSEHWQKKSRRRKKRLYMPCDTPLLPPPCRKCFHRFIRFVVLHQPVNLHTNHAHTHTHARACASKRLHVETPFGFLFGISPSSSNPYISHIQRPLAPLMKQVSRKSAVYTLYSSRNRACCSAGSPPMKASKLEIMPLYC